MALTLYSAACVTFILVCFAMLWPLRAALRAVNGEIRQLQHETDLGPEQSEGVASTAS